MLKAWAFSLQNAPAVSCHRQQSTPSVKEKSRLVRNICRFSEAPLVYTAAPSLLTGAPLYDRLSRLTMWLLQVGTQLYRWYLLAASLPLLPVCQLPLRKWPGWLGLRMLLWMLSRRIPVLWWLGTVVLA